MAFRAFDRFEEFVSAQPLEGLGADVRTLQNLCRDNVAALDLIDAAVKAGQRQGERTDLARNPAKVRRSPKAGTRQEALRRLRENAPERLAEVTKPNGKSPHAAMVEAGLRRKRVSVYTDDAASAVRSLLRFFSSDELRAALESAGYGPSLAGTSPHATREAVERAARQSSVFEGARRRTVAASAARPEARGVRARNLTDPRGCV